MWKMPRAVFLLALALICVVLQVPLVFWGAELCDAGFYLTFYQNFFDAPESVSYNFMYWLSGLIGAIWTKVFPGMAAMRVAGLLANTGCALLLATIFSVRRYRPWVVAGTLLCLCGQWQLPLTLSYDMITALLTLVGLLLLTRALTGGNLRRASWIMLAAGVVIGANTFTRIPNVAGILYIFLIPIVISIFQRRGAGLLSAVFAAGWLAGICLILALMAAMGHLQIFIANMQELFGVAAQGSEASHGFGPLVAAQISAWKWVLSECFVIIFLGLLTLAARRGMNNRIVRRITLAVIGLLLLYIFYKARVITSAVSLVLVGVVLATITGGRSLRSGAWAGLAMMLIFPLGSDGGLFNNSTYILWCACVPGLYGYRSFAKRFVPAWERGAGIASICYALAIVLLAMAQAAIGGVYFDTVKPLQASGTIPAPLASGIRTSQQTATAIEETLKGVEKGAGPGERILIFGSAPLLHYLSETQPAIGNSWPEQLSAEMLGEQLRERMQGAPVLLVKYPTIGGTGKPSDDFLYGRDPYSDIYHNAKKTGVLLQYLGEEGYSTATETPLYILFTKQ